MPKQMHYISCHMCTYVVKVKKSIKNEVRIDLL